MTIGIDARLWGESGVGRYIRNLVINIAKIDKRNSYVIFILESDRKSVENAISNNWKVVSSNSRWHTLSEQINFPKIIAREKVDLMHFPYHSIPVFYRSPYVVTIHDLIPYHFVTGNASNLPLWLYGFKSLAYRYVVNSATRNARKVIAVSEFTKRDVIDNLQVRKDKVEVIYEAADDFKQKVQNKERGKYFLYVGNVYPHKNADKLVKAFENFIHENQEYSLVFVGKEDEFYKKFRKSYKKLEKKGAIIFENNASDERLSNLYNNATALVRPSLMEGFSLPPLEAMQSACLVIASDIPVHREIFKDAILYFDPTNVLEISEAMKKVAGLSPDEKKEMVQKGRKIVDSLSWEKTVRQTLAVYESSLSL